MKPDEGPAFHVNEEVYVEPTEGSPGFHTHIIGFKPHLCLILEHPFKDSSAHPLRPNEFLWIRCLQSTMFRFKSRLLRIIDDPVPLLLLSYPNAVEEINLRETERKKIFLRGTFFDLQDRQNDRSWEGYILDISDSGCLMWGDFVHLVDRDILLTFRIPWTGETIQAKARVVRCEVTDKGIRSGLRFIDVDPETQQRLHEFIGSLKDDRLSQIVVQPLK
jgi:c-di-GMP-binding flagellar brake protein YcgR